jgi:hypothetical protein
LLVVLGCGTRSTGGTTPDAATARDDGGDAPASDRPAPGDAAADAGADVARDGRDARDANAGVDGAGGVDSADGTDAADAPGGGDGADACGSCDDHDPCTVDVCEPAAGCRHVNASACAQPFCQLGGGCGSWRDSDGDGLSDAWEANGYVDLDCNGADDGPSVDLELPGADPAVADVYVQYDWMDYGPMETPCNTGGDCTIMAGLANATCTGPAPQGFNGSCVLPCVVDADCTALGPTHATDRCAQTGVRQCLHTHDPALLAPDGNGGSTALAAVVEAFARHRINLHVVRGHALPHSHVLSLRPLNAIGDACEGGSLAGGTAGPGRYAESFYDLKAGSFDPRRAVAYHYAIFAHLYQCDTVDHCAVCPAPLNPDGTTKSLSMPIVGRSGAAEISGNDILVSLANYINEVGNPPERFDIGGTFMHELGHNLGMSHGGGFISTGDAESLPEFKPNYLSVMNYNYQFVGIGVGAAVGDKVPKACALDADCPAGALCTFGRCRRLDYSTQVLPTGTATPGLLDENGRLDEGAGLGSGTSDTFFFVDAACQFHEAATQGPVDWDGDGVAGDDAAATADLNPEAHPSSQLCGVDTTERFRGHADWGPAGAPLFTYEFQCTAGGGD